MMVCMADSSTLAIGDSRAIGLYDVCRLGSLFGLRIGNIFAVFHVVGMILVLMILFYKLVSMEMEW